MSILDKFGEVLCAGDGFFEFAALEAVDLSLAKLPTASFASADLYWVTFFDADLSTANFNEATLRGVDLKMADCRQANFSRSKFLPDALGLPCELHDADFSNAKFDGADFVCAKFNRKTRWPPGFDPSQYPGLQIDK